MRKFVNDMGCSMNFDEGISQEQIDMRLGMFGNRNKWREVVE